MQQGSKQARVLLFVLLLLQSSRRERDVAAVSRKDIVVAGYGR